MKSFPSIPGYRDFLGQRCWAFQKYDGSNLRFEWSPKRGWYKTGTRTRLFDKSDPVFGGAVEIFDKAYGEQLIAGLEALRIKLDKGVIAFCEFFGPDSFAGMHGSDDEKELVLFDVNINKRGLLLPDEFLELGEHTKTAELLYTGDLDEDFVERVQSGDVADETEGVVTKGFGRKRSVHSLWMAKVKTRRWLEKLREHAALHGHLAAEVAANAREQGVR